MPRKKPSRSFSAVEGSIFRIKIRLLGISPMIWRRVLVPASCTLHELHGVIQAVMGWEGLHLYQFKVRAITYGSFDLMVEDPAVLFESFDFRKNTKLAYIYDMGAWWEHELRIEVVNVDLICGWFDQKEEDLESDLRLLMPHAPESIVVHPLTLAGPSHFVQEQARLPTPRETCDTFMRGRRFLQDHQYRGTSYTDYMLLDPPHGPDEVQYLLMYRDVFRYDRIGIGYGANSLFAGTTRQPGRTWRNFASFDGYYQALDEKLVPAEEGFLFSPLDLELLYILKGLEGTPFITKARYAHDIGGDLYNDYADQWQVLEEMD